VNNAGVVGTWVVPFIVLLVTDVISYKSLQSQKQGWEEMVQAMEFWTILGDNAVEVSLSEEDKSLLRESIAF